MKNKEVKLKFEIGKEVNDNSLKIHREFLRHISVVNSSYLKAQEDAFLQYGMKLISPPIKGEITKGKLKYRGIRRCTRFGGLSGEYIEECWFEQRGRQITPVIRLGLK